MTPASDSASNVAAAAAWISDEWRTSACFASSVLGSAAGGDLPAGASLWTHMHAQQTAPEKWEATPQVLAALLSREHYGCSAEGLVLWCDVAHTRRRMQWRPQAPVLWETPTEPTWSRTRMHDCMHVCMIQVRSACDPLGEDYSGWEQ